MTMPNPKTTTSEPTAIATYAAHRNDIARLLDLLDMELEASDLAQAVEPKNWGHAGNLRKVREELIGLVGFMSNKEPIDVEAFLNETK